MTTPLPDESATISDAWHSIVEFDAPVSESAAISDAWEIFNWSKFLRVTLPKAVTCYICEIENPAFSNIFNEIPISSFQIRSSWGAYPYIQVVVPGNEYKTLIKDSYLNHRLRLSASYKVAGVEVHSEPIFTVFVESYDDNDGPENTSISITARGTSVWTGINVVALEKNEVAYSRIKRDKYAVPSGSTFVYLEYAQLRIYRLDPFIRLGTLISFSGHSYTVSQITANYSSDDLPTSEILARRIIV